VVNLVFDSKGQVTGVSRVRFKIQLNDKSDSATGTAVIETLDFNGSVVSTISATLELKRLTADPLRQDRGHRLSPRFQSAAAVRLVLSP